MEEIDVTRKLRPQKVPATAPASPVAPTFPILAPAPPPTGATPQPPAPASLAELHTIRFAPVVADVPVVPPLPHESDPVTGWLVVIKGLGRSRSLPLGYGIHPIGRAEDQRVPVRFGDKKISRRSHLEISYDSKGRAFYLAPGRGGSTLGYLNGQPVLQPSLLSGGDRITLGDTELMFVPFCSRDFDWQVAD